MSLNFLRILFTDLTRAKRIEDHGARMVVFLLLSILHDLYLNHVKSQDMRKCNEKLHVY